jgi:hypothetical protein
MKAKQGEKNRIGEDFGMSKYESFSGNGVAKQADLRELRRRMMEAHNALLAAHGAPKKDMANTRTTSFPFSYWYRDDEYKAGGFFMESGSVSIDVAGGTFHFSVGYNNHAMDDAEASKVFQILMRFLNSMPEKGFKYGAKTYYTSEYDQDEFNNPSPGTTRYYGAWKSQDENYRLLTRSKGYKRRNAARSLLAKSVRGK